MTLGLNSIWDGRWNALQERDAMLRQAELRSETGGKSQQGSEEQAEQQLLLTRKVSSIMSGVLQSKMDKDAKMELSLAISDMLQLLLRWNCTWRWPFDLRNQYCAFAVSLSRSKMYIYFFLNSYPGQWVDFGVLLWFLLPNLLHFSVHLWKTCSLCVWAMCK